MGYNIIFTFIKLYLPGRKKNKMNEDLLVIKKNEVPAIQFNKEELIERVDEILEQHKGIIYTIEDIPEAKKVVADLRKQKKYLNSERISACKPYEAIVKQTKTDMDDVLARYDTVIQEIDTQIKESENVWKKEREDYIRETYEDVFLHEIPEKYLVCPIIKNLKIDSKWMLKSTSKKKIKDQMIEKRDKILSDINTLKCVAEEEFLSDVEQEYFKELDLNKAIKKNQSLREAKQKVLEAVEKLHYIPNMNAKLLKSNRKNTIGLFVTSLQGDFYNVLTQAIHLQCKLNNYMLNIYVSNDNSPDEISSRPAIILSVVDLPQPDGPTKMINSLSLISRLKSFTALNPFG
mgnify:CR=1 FL=1